MKKTVKKQARKIGSGGARPGAGKKLLYGEKTISIGFKIPISRIPEFREKTKKLLKTWRIKTGSEKIISGENQGVAKKLEK